MEDDIRISINDCNGFSGEFADTPAYEIRKISGQEAKERGFEYPRLSNCLQSSAQAEYICNDIFGILYDDKEGYGGWSKYLLNEIHTSVKGKFTYFKFVLHKLDDFPIAIDKMIWSIRLNEYKENF
ncbi:hypothetical protein HY029_01520 [Candidatus Gottesmanbacteria bacterium]|nr:hypothetical protein [Candidatus Gottesmanbacteria bacterium]